MREISYSNEKGELTDWYGAVESEMQAAGRANLHKSARLSRVMRGKEINDNGNSDWNVLWNEIQKEAMKERMKWPGKAHRQSRKWTGRFLEQILHLLDAACICWIFSKVILSKSMQIKYIRIEVCIKWYEISYNLDNINRIDLGKL